VESILAGPPARVAPAEPETQVFVASQWQLMWWRFSKHRAAMISGIIVLLIYLVALFPEILAPYASDVVNARYLYAPPQALHLFTTTDAGLRFAPHVFGYKSVVDAAAGRRTFTIDESIWRAMPLSDESFSIKTVYISPSSSKVPTVKGP